MIHFDRSYLKEMNRTDLIGSGENCLVPDTQKKDNMLLTQVSMYPQPRMQSTKTKLPTLRVF